MTTRMFVAASSILVIHGSVHADITYLTQSRSITATAQSGLVTDSHGASASSFGLFDESVNAHAFNPDTGFSGFGSASQMSRFDPAEIIAAGSWSGSRDGQAGFPSGGGTSSFHVSFMIDQPVSYEFIASITGGASSIAFVFTGGGPGGGLDIHQPGTYSGVLEPGPYFLDGGTTGSAGFPPSGGGFSLRLTVPSPSTAFLGGLVALNACRRRRPQKEQA